MAETDEPRPAQGRARTAVTTTFLAWLDNDDGRQPYPLLYEDRGVRYLAVFSTEQALFDAVSAEFGTEGGPRPRMQPVTVVELARDAPDGLGIVVDHGTEHAVVVKPEDRAGLVRAFHPLPADTPIQVGLPQAYPPGLLEHATAAMRAIPRVRTLRCPLKQAEGGEPTLLFAVETDDDDPNAFWAASDAIHLVLTMIRPPVTVDVVHLVATGSPFYTKLRESIPTSYQRDGG